MGFRRPRMIDDVISHDTPEIIITMGCAEQCPLVPGARKMDWDLPDEEATTVAGLVIHEAQTIPEPGQVFTFYGYRFEILRKNRNKIAALRVKPVHADAA